MSKITADKLLKVIKLKGSGRAETVQRARKALESFYLRFSSINNVTVEPFLVDHIPAFWISAPDVSKDHTILFFHGGGFVVGSTKDHLDLCGKLSIASGYHVLSIDYRLAPEHAFPAALEDCVNTYLWLTDQGVGPQQIIPVGISAGGNLVLSLFFRLRAMGIPLPEAAVLISPAVDLASSGDSRETNAEKDWINAEGLEMLKKAYLRKHDPKDPFVSPTYGDLGGLPALFVQAGTHETLLNDINDFVRKSKEAGVDVTFDVWEEMFHCWQIFSSILPEGQQAIDRIGAYIRDKFQIG